MIRQLQKEDFEKVIQIVNQNWITVYNQYVNPLLLNEEGCQRRECHLKHDFQNHRLYEYVWVENNQVLGMLSIGKTSDEDKPNVLEIWRIYIDSSAQGKGIGKQLLAYGEQKAQEEGYNEVVIWVFKENHRALKFYQKNGYVKDKEEYLGEPYLTTGIRLLKKLA